MPMPADDTALRAALDAEAKRLIVDTTYTGRGHQAAGGRWATLNYWLGLPTAVGTALLAGGAGISAIIDRHAWLTAVLAFSATIASAVHGFLRPSERSDGHSLKGNRFIDLRNDARLFRELDLHSDLAVEELSARIRALRRRYADLNEAPPLQIPPQDYKAAKRSIDAGESSYENDPIWKELST